MHSLPCRTQLHRRASAQHGVAWRDGRFVDYGAGQGDFKTPTLREIARTGPYIHDSSIGTLQDVIEYYDRGCIRNPALDAELHPLHLSAREKQVLFAFHRSLNGVIQSENK
jgi:cytochrome c peroxidase